MFEQVVETMDTNSGISHGRIVRRQLIPNPRGGVYTLDDVDLGRSLIIFGRTFNILDCDLFTREYLELELGRDVTPLEMPVDTKMKHNPSILTPKSSRLQLKDLC